MIHAEDLPTFRHQVVLITRDFCHRPGVLWGAVLLFISYVWISKIHFRISIIHFWIAIIHFWISKNEFRISQNNYGYPKIFGYPKMYFRISTNRFSDIHNSFLDIQKYIKIHIYIYIYIYIYIFLSFRTPLSKLKCYTRAI